MSALNGGSPPSVAPRRARKAVIESDPEDEVDSLAAAPAAAGTAYSMDTDISQLEAPTFTTLDRGPSQKMMELSWDHKVNLIGKKVVNPMIHNCDQCDKPILIYGRMIPCKHVFCHKCATAALNEQSGDTGAARKCPRCKDKVVRVEQAGLGSIYMCNHGGSRYGSNGCRRTYLSQRDLQAHIQHRHIKVNAAPTPVPSATVLPPNVPSAAAITAVTHALAANRNNSKPQQQAPAPPQQQHPMQPYYSQPPPVASQQRGASNLITVPIQDNSSGQPWQQQSAYTQPPPNYSQQAGPQQQTGGYQYHHHHHHPPSHPPPQYDQGQQWQTSGSARTYYNSRR